MNLCEYKNKTILVTGHTGFKGSWLCIWLLELGANVIGVSKDPYTKNDNFVMSKLGDKLTDLRCDIKDLDKLIGIFDEYKPEVVFHLAAQPLVRLSYKEPVETYNTNVMGTINVLECIRTTDSVHTGIIVTSDKCYENVNQIWTYRETDRLGGYDPYSSSKACAELIVSSYINSFFNTDSYSKHGKYIASVRAGNVIGGGDWSEDRIVPDVVRSIRNKVPIEIRNPQSTRPWQHVLEPIRGYLLLGEKLILNKKEFIGAWNFGPDGNDFLSVENIVKKIINIWGEGNYSIGKNSGPHEANLLSIDSTKAKIYLEWKPVFDIDKAVHMTIEWYKNYESVNVYDFCVSQIKNVEKLI